MAVSLKNQFPGEEEAIDELMRLMKVKRDRSKGNHKEVDASNRRVQGLCNGLVY